MDDGHVVPDPLRSRPRQWPHAIERPNVMTIALSGHVMTAGRSGPIGPFPRYRDRQRGDPRERRARGSAGGGACRLAVAAAVVRLLEELRDALRGHFQYLRDIPPRQACLPEFAGRLTSLVRSHSLRMA